MKFIEFKLPSEIGELATTGYYLISKISIENDFQIAFRHSEDDDHEIVFDFGWLIDDFRISDEGRRLCDHHVAATDPKTWHHYPKSWLFAEVKDSEYLKKLDEAECGLPLLANPDLKHYMTGDIHWSIDIISTGEPTVYKTTRGKRV